MPLRLPTTAFDSLDVPVIGHFPALPAEDERRLLAARLLMMAGLSFRKLQRPLNEDALIRQISSIDRLDALVIDVALEVLPAEVWHDIEETLASFGKDAIPKIYQGRDRRLCGLILVLRNRPLSDDEDLVKLFRGFDSACRYDEAHYNAILANMAAQGVLNEIAHLVLVHLGEQQP
ncbi:hypothetical protein [Vreelandella nigrificans]|uniref:Uncharacterized protein n=1 Tax=Vreelandella nigrificans TaxID=2042704 RepID=A0A2A4HGS3_9GAMM|nr:hypothetical protein [Halomonas nigrificans]PCF94072.1 hypothetical protein CPA45_19030 [Halomonas nigrificans]